MPPSLLNWIKKSWTYMPGVLLLFIALQQVLNKNKKL